jgi:hypothetical protein
VASFAKSRDSIYDRLLHDLKVDEKTVTILYIVFVATIL